MCGKWITREHAQADITNKSWHDWLSSNFFADTESHKMLIKCQTSKSVMTVDSHMKNPALLRSYNLIQLFTSSLHSLTNYWTRFTNVSCIFHTRLLHPPSVTKSYSWCLHFKRTSDFQALQQSIWHFPCHLFFNSSVLFN